MIFGNKVWRDRAIKLQRKKAEITRKLWVVKTELHFPKMFSWDDDYPIFNEFNRVFSFAVSLSIFLQISLSLNLYFKTLKMHVWAIVRAMDLIKYAFFKNRTRTSNVRFCRNELFKNFCAIIWLLNFDCRAKRNFIFLSLVNLSIKINFPMSVENQYSFRICSASTVEYSTLNNMQSVESTAEADQNILWYSDIKTTKK